MSALYIVATPIGNVEDISLRALRILGQVQLVAAEDTRKTRRLLAVYGIKTQLTSYHEHNKDAKLPYLLRRLESDDVALVAEAGMPGISDPGYELVVAASEGGIPLIPIPGPSVLVTALAVSGLPINQFTYLGFLPRRKGRRKRLLEQVAGEERTILALEAPHRLVSALQDILGVLGDRRIAVCRELTKLHEEVFRGTVREAIAHFPEPKGELTLVIGGGQGKRDSFEEAEQQLRLLYEKGVSAKEAVSQVANATAASKKQVYRLWLGLR
jgi:16S rRNA (cytidine1402-2'-O)-methyltransferase